MNEIYISREKVNLGHNNAASLIKKTETVRVFDPSENVQADAWKFDYRLYYDVFVKKSLSDTIYAYLYEE